MEVYYANAIQAVLRCRPFPELFVFSDDPDWCETRFGAFGLPMSVVSSHGAEDPLADFFLMTQCRAFIIANSAYSWWAAWLCRASDKIVMAPCRWETRGLLDMDRFIPEGWTKIEW